MSAVDAESKEGMGNNVETQPVTRRGKAPNPKLQAPEKLQAPNPNLVFKGAIAAAVSLLIGSLVFGYSLVLGAWFLELPRRYSLTP
jgi:hypothetical protein